MNRRRPTRALASGFVALAAWRLASILTVWTVLPALLAASPLVPALRDAFSETLAGDHVLRNHPTFAATDAFDFLHDYRAVVAGTGRAAQLAGVFGIVAQIFFAGGLVEVLGRGRRPSVLDFVEGARRNFWHNVKCFLLFAVAATIAIALWIGAASAAGRLFFASAPPGDRAHGLFRWGVALVTFLLYAGFSLWHDFARAARRLDPRIGAWRGYGVARRALAGRRLRAMALFLFWLILGAAVAGALFAAAWTLQAVSIVSIALLFALQLATLFARSSIRLAAWGSSIALFDSSPFAYRSRAVLLTAEPAAAARTPPEPEPEQLGPFWDDTPLV